MKNFVKLIQQAHAERFFAVLNRIVTQQIPVAFLSLDSIAQAVETVNKFRAQGLNITLLIVADDTPPPADLDFAVVHVTDADKLYPQPEYVFVATADSDARLAIKYLPASKVLSLNMGDGNYLYETFMAHLDDLQEVYASLIDEESKKVFRGYWLAKITAQSKYLVFANTPHYICAGFIPAAGAIVIDGGLCDGGTALRFKQMGYEVYGFEPDHANYDVARKVGAENNFVVENFGLGSYKHETTFKHYENPGASRVDINGTETVKITTLDSYVREKNLPRVDFLKLDVEGAELDVLRGAATTIARFKPILALSAYHKPDDLWTLMNFVKSIRPDYEFAMRQFAISREDGAYHFNDDTEKTLDFLGLRPVLTGFGECVLFAR